MDPRPIAPIRHALVSARARVPASKSVTNRELVLSAIATGRSRIETGALDPGDDVRAMAAALTALGHEVRWQGGRIEVTPHVVPYAETAFDAGESGTVARFATALAALSDRETHVDGSARLRQRPMAPLIAALRELGATIDRDALPLTVRGPVRGGEVSVSGFESSQFASALLLVGPRMPEGLHLRITGGLVSAPFLEMTITALSARGVKVERPTTRSFIIAPQKVKPRTLVVPGDVTAATYPAAAAALLGGKIAIENASTRKSGGQGDARFFELIEQMGCAVDRGATSTTVRRTGSLLGIVANVSDCSDVFPTLAVIATQAETPTELEGLGHTRRQESDRLAAVAAAIKAVGGRAQVFGDAIRIEPVPLAGGVVDAAGDHRIAMAFSVLGLLVPGIAIAGSDAVTKTFPGFYEMLGGLGR